MNHDQWSLMQLAFGGFQAQVVSVFASMDLGDHLAARPLAVEELAKLADCHAPSLHRVLRAAAYLGLVNKNGAGQFGLTPAGRLLCADAPGGVKHYTRMISQGMWRVTGRLDHTVRTGEAAFDHLLGHLSFESLAERPGDSALVYDWVIELARIEAPSVAKVCDLSGVSSLVDVGGGNGYLMSCLLAANPELAGVIIDMKIGLQQTPVVLAAAGVGDRCELVAGDFFSDPIPAGRDMYLIKSTLHDWDDEHVVRLLRNCRESMRPGCRLLIVEPVMPADFGELSDQMTVMVMSDLCTMVGNAGKIRTEPEWRELLDAAGLILTDVTDHQADLGFTILQSIPG